MVSRTSRTTPEIHDNRDNGAMSKLDVSSNSIRSEGCSALAGILNQSSITDLNIASNDLTCNAQGKRGVMDGIIKLAGVMEDNGAMSILNIMGNKFGKEQLEKFKAIKESKSLQSICGIASDATEANLSGLGMDAADAAVLAEDIQDKGALSKLDIKNNDIDEERKAEIQQTCDLNSITCLL